LICSTRRRQGDKGCYNSLWVPYFDFRDEVISELSDKLKRIIDAESITNDYKGKIVKTKTNDNEKEIKKIDKAIESTRKLLFELRKQKMLGELDNEQYLYEKELYEKEITSHQSKLAQSTAKVAEQVNIEIIYDAIRTALNNLAELTFDHMDEMRVVLSKLIEKITISKDGEVEIYTPLGQLEA